MSGENHIKAARFYTHHDIRIETVPKPQAKENEVLVDISWCGICGTDLVRQAGNTLLPRFEV